MRKADPSHLEWFRIWNSVCQGRGGAEVGSTRFPSCKVSLFPLICLWSMATPGARTRFRGKLMLSLWVYAVSAGNTGLVKALEKKKGSNVSKGWYYSKSLTKISSTLQSCGAAVHCCLILEPACCCCQGHTVLATPQYPSKRCTGNKVIKTVAAWLMSPIPWIFFFFLNCKRLLWFSLVHEITPTPCLLEAGKDLW